MKEVEKNEIKRLSDRLDAIRHQQADLSLVEAADKYAELEKEKSELLAKCEKYECEIGLAKQQIAALESKSNMYIDLSVAMASTARKVDGLEKDRGAIAEAYRQGYRAGMLAAIRGEVVKVRQKGTKQCL